MNLAARVTGPADTTTVLGIDAAGRLGWVGVVIGEQGVERAVVGSLDEIVESAGPVRTIGIDIPLGATRGRNRAADIEARRFVGRRRSSVFAAPSLDEIGELGHAEHNAELVAAGRPKISAQAWALLPKMREAAALAAVDNRLHEVHPEVSFRAMKGADLRWSKKSWNGQHLRIELLRQECIELPRQLGDVGRVATDDLLDAAAAAWSARRIAQGISERFPSTDEFDGDRLVAIWY